jgi:putative lipoprotein
MRNQILPALLAFGLLAGCNKAPPPPPPAAAVANSVSGTIMLREPRALGDNARAELKVIDVSQPATPLAQITVEHANRPPIAFNMPIDVSAVDPLRTYAVNAVLIDGERRYMPVLEYPVLTKKAQSQGIQIIVAPEPTPAEKMYEAYKQAYAQIGSLKSISGSSETPTSTTAWDAFVSNGKVKVVREITSIVNDKAEETGRVTTKIAYQNDKPWVVVKEESSGAGMRPFAITKVGWDESGTLVLKDKLANGQASEASAAEAKTLYDHAVQAFNVAEPRAAKK